MLEKAYLEKKNWLKYQDAKKQTLAENILIGFLSYLKIDKIKIKIFNNSTKDIKKL